MSRPAVGISCPKCGGQSHLRQGRSSGSELCTAMRIVNRVRVCKACGFSFRTVEIDCAELSDLRRRAYLYDRTSAKEQQC